MRARVLVVEKRSAYDTYGRTDPAAVRLLASRDVTVRRIMPAHREHQATAAAVRAIVSTLGVDATYVQCTRDDGWFPTFDRGPDLVVTVGGDGTLLAASHHVGDGTPILGINSSPADSVGFFCAATRATAERTIRSALAGSLERVRLARMQVTIDDEVVHSRVLNEALFCHASPAATSRYIMRVEGKRRRGKAEEQKSSGLWVGPAAGSTAAQKSAGGRVLPLGSRSLQFVVREPYTPEGRRLHMTRGLVADGERLVVACKMQKARLFLDGLQATLRVGLGDVLAFERSRESLTVLGLSRTRQKSSTTRETRK